MIVAVDSRQAMRAGCRNALPATMTLSVRRWTSLGYAGPAKMQRKRYLLATFSYE
jgi:hypothetical protein